MIEGLKERIKTIIDHYNLTVSTFADNIGVQRSTISHLISGRNKPSLDFVMKVVQTYPAVNIYWLLNGKGSFPALEEKKEDSPVPSSGEVKKNSLEVSPSSTLLSKTDVAEPIRIVMFYSDGTFESFETKK